MMERITNREVRKYIEGMEEFTNQNHTLYATWERQEERYCVFSYRDDWPILVAEKAPEGDWQWYENADRYSATTNRHTALARPPQRLLTRPIVPMSVGAMRRIVRHGIAGLAAMGEL